MITDQVLEQLIVELSCKVTRTGVEYAFYDEKISKKAALVVKYYKEYILLQQKMHKEQTDYIRGY